MYNCLIVIISSKFHSAIMLDDIDCSPFSLGKASKKQIFYSQTDRKRSPLDSGVNETQDQKWMNNKNNSKVDPQMR